MSGLFRCNMENDEMGRASSSHSNLTQHAWVRQQLARKAASHFPEPTYVTSRSREHFREGKAWEGPAAEVVRLVGALKTSFCLSSRRIINKISYERFNERRNDCGVANLSRVPLECPWRRRDEQLINTSTSWQLVAAAADSTRTTSREYRQSFPPLWKSFLLLREGLTRRAFLSLPFSSSIRSFLAALIEFLLLRRYFLPSSSLSQDRLAIKMLSRSKKKVTGKHETDSHVFLI